MHDEEDSYEDLTSVEEKNLTLESLSEITVLHAVRQCYIAVHST